MEKVKVIADEAGNVVVPLKDNPSYGYIRVQQKRREHRGPMKNITARVVGTTKELEKKNWVEGQELEGKIIIIEQLNPFDGNHPEKDYKIAGKTGIVCSIYGEPIYRKTFYKESLEAEDSYILDSEGHILMHTNTDEIKEAYEKGKTTM